MADNGFPIAEARNVTVSFGDGDKSRVVLQDVCLAVREGQVVAILGPSGCGKSTLLRALVGFLKPSQGSVFAHGQPLEGIHPGMSLVFQNFALFPWLTVQENIAVALSGLGMSQEAGRQRVARCIDVVGLEGFEEAYPKELSGGMKQRVGIARALARGPELLCMDEPFSALDVFTAESLRSEVYRLWSGGGSKLPFSLKSVIIITHVIEEAVFLADQIVVMGSRPGTIRQTILNDVPHPREYQSPPFQKLVQRLHDIITKEEGAMLDTEAAPGDEQTAADGMPVPEPIPPVSPGQIFGLMEILRDHGGQMDVFNLDQLTEYDFGHTLSVVKAGEMLEFLDTPKSLVVLTDLGRAFLDADVNGRKTLFRRQLEQLTTFRFVRRLLEEATGGELTKEIVEEELCVRLCTEDIPKLIDVIINWGRYGELFGYSPDSERLYLDQPAAATGPGGE
jgi:NitT/TauT family transport system ATP-binding protein